MIRKQGFYAAIGIGAAFDAKTPINSTPGSGITNESFQSSSVAAPSVAFGYVFSNQWRTEIEYYGIYTSAKNNLTSANCAPPNPCGSLSVSGNQVSTSLIQLHLIKGISTGSRFMPYIGGGLGIAANRYTTPQGSASGTTFAGQGKAGISYAISKTTNLDLGYRIVGIGGGTSLTFWGDRSTIANRVQQSVDLTLRVGL